MNKPSMFFKPMVYSYAIGLSYFFLHYFFLFSLTAPSDPLQYVNPALYPENGFPFFDRILLWLWIRFVSIFPLPVYEIGGIATLLLTSVSLVLGSLILLKEKLYLGLSVFVLLFFSSPIISGISSYTYPMQMLSFIIILSVFVLINIKRFPVKFFLFGFFLSLSVLSKVQGIFFSLVFFVLYFTCQMPRSFRVFLNCAGLAFLGFVSGLALVFSIIVFLDGLGAVELLYQMYFESNVSESQFAGRAAGGIPPVFLMLYQPIFLLSFVSVIYCVVKPVSTNLKLMSFVAFFQVFGLLVIYIVTQRGGPLIFNYFMDFQLIGLLIASYLIGDKFKNRFKYSFLFPVVSLVVAGIVIFISQIYKVEPYPYVPDGKYLWFGAVFLIAFALYRHPILVGKKIMFLILLFGSVLFFLGEFYHAIKHSLFAQSFAAPYHRVASQISNLECEEGGYIYVSSKVNRHMVIDGTARLKKIYTAFYSDNAGCDVTFGAESIDVESPPTFIVTDRVELLPQKILSQNDVDLTSGIPANGISTEVVNSNKLNFKIAGIRGRGHFYASNLASPRLIYKPFKAGESAVLQIDVASPSYVTRERFVKLSVKKGYNNSQYKLFVQYKQDGRYKRYLSSFSEGVHNVIAYIPVQAEEISYGFRYHTDIADNAISFPNLSLSIIEIDNYVPGRVTILRY